MLNAFAALLAERYVIITPLIKSVTIIAQGVLIEANTLVCVSTVTLLSLPAIIYLKFLNNLVIFDANASNLSSRVSDVYSLNETSLVFLLYNLTNQALRKFKRVSLLVIRPKLEPAIRQILYSGLNKSKQYCSLLIIPALSLDSIISKVNLEQPCFNKALQIMLWF